MILDTYRIFGNFFKEFSSKILFSTNFKRSLECTKAQMFINTGSKILKYFKASIVLLELLVIFEKILN